MLGYEKNISTFFFVKEHKKRNIKRKKSVIINSPQITQRSFSIMFQQNRFYNNCWGIEKISQHFL